MVSVPVFDVEALEAWADVRDRPPADGDELLRLWRQLVDDVVAAAEHIQLLQLERAGRSTR